MSADAESFSLAQWTIVAVLCPYVGTRYSKKQPWKYSNSPGCSRLGLAVDLTPRDFKSSVLALNCLGTLKSLAVEPLEFRVKRCGSTYSFLLLTAVRSVMAPAAAFEISFSCFP